MKRVIEQFLSIGNLDDVTLVDNADTVGDESYD